MTGSILGRKWITADEERELLERALVSCKQHLERYREQEDADGITETEADMNDILDELQKLNRRHGTLLGRRRKRAD